MVKGDKKWEGKIVNLMENWLKKDQTRANEREDHAKGGIISKKGRNGEEE